MNETRIGLHVSIAGTIDQAVDRAVARGCNTFQIFTRNPRGWKFKALENEAIAAFKDKVAKEDIYPVASHMPYLPNLSSPKRSVYNLSVKTLVAELERSGQLGLQYVVTNLGSHLGVGYEAGLEQIRSACNHALSIVENDVRLLLENTAGQKHSMGHRFEEIQRIINGIEYDSRVGVCFDTSHAFAAGYELRTKEGLHSTLGMFDKIIGLKRLEMIHLNDSKGDLGSNLDRHEHIELGKIGANGFRNILHNDVIRSRPLVLETPIDNRRNDVQNLKRVRQLAE
ncbi:MAG: deoxyribonuclease IV [archaeon]